MNGSNWQIQHQCPQCGAPVILEETDRLLSCAFCRTRLYIVSPGPCHYYIPAPATAETVYIPYWRLRGLAYQLQPPEMTPSYVDANRQALPIKGLPPSLGVRPQAMKLKFLSPDSPGVFLRPKLKAEETLPQAAAPLAMRGRNVFIGEAVSLIYSPMLLRNNTLADAFRPGLTMSWTDAERGEYPLLDAAARDGTRFLPVLCPACGWDLQGTRDSVLLTCHNCQSAWSCNGAALEKTPFRVMTGADDDLHYLPFWRLKVRFEGLSLESRADLIRLANLPRAVTPEMEKTAVHFWSPAFKVNPALFMRWARQATVFQPDEDYGETLPQRQLYPVNLSAGEALESVLVTLAGIVTDKRVFFAILPRLKMHAEETLLVYQPFAAAGKELIHERMKVVIDRKALTFGALM